MGIGKSDTLATLNGRPKMEQRPGKEIIDDGGGRKGGGRGTQKGEREPSTSSSAGGAKGSLEVSRGGRNYKLPDPVAKQNIKKNLQRERDNNIVCLRSLGMFKSSRSIRAGWEGLREKEDLGSC